MAGDFEGTPLTVLILTYNEQLHLARCLRSLEGLDARIFVVDSGSTDDTVGIAKDAGASVVFHPFENQAAQLNWALKSLPPRTSWVLRLDGDEYLLPQLRDEIKNAIAEAPHNVTGYYMKRRVLFLGRWIRHGGYYPTWLLRLFRYGEARCEEATLNEHMMLTEGRSANLKHDFVDEDLEGLASWTIKHAGYAARQADFLSEVSARTVSDRLPPRLFGPQPHRKRWLVLKVYLRIPLFLRALMYFIHRYIFRLGFLDGVPGLIFHFLQGLWFPFYADSLLYELRSGRDQPTRSPAVRTNVT